MQTSAATPAPLLRLQDYSDALVAKGAREDIYRAIVREVPRLFHALSRDEQHAVLMVAPSLTGTHWDALLAATVEHLATLHGHPIPIWVSKPERFLAIPWIVCMLPEVRNDCLAYAPAAFIRHGALPDPLDLDERGGERHDWVPEP